MIISAIIVILKVRGGSKNVFAYVLMSFNALLGISYMGNSFDEAYRRLVVVNGTTYKVPNAYANYVCNYFLYIA
jgi:hypothetical protein